MSPATRAPQPIPLSIRAEDLLIAAAVLAALGDRRQHASLQQAAKAIRVLAGVAADSLGAEVAA